MKLPIEEILLKGNYITAEDVKKARDWAKDHEGGVETYFLSKNLLTRELIGQAVAESFKVPFADLVLRPPAPEMVVRISIETAQKFTAVVFHEEQDSIEVATDVPDSPELKAELAKLFTGKKVSLAYAPKGEITEFFRFYEEPLILRIIEEIGKEVRSAPEIVKQIFNEALSRRASDVHFEPQEEEVIVRFRIDGVLFVVGKLPRLVYENILNRIKVSAKLRIDEHQAAQDGAIRFAREDSTVDMRVSIVPTTNGETVVIRILSEYVESVSFPDLGLSSEHQKILVENSKKPFGMILVTGPTGSGKTTTLYSLVKNLSRPEINITTIEDPVEYKIEAINQIQVNTATNLTFAKGLKSIIRQDPDVILVGEVRDLETAEIAVNAALTGQLLFSTFHANDTAGAIPRLLTMGIEPFLLSSTLELLISQRLVRKICSNCRYSYKEKAGKFFGNREITLYRGKGCKFCHDTGYLGRTAIFEFLPNTPELHDLILTNPSAGQIRELAAKLKLKTLFDDGIEKVKNGITTLEEVVRVSNPPVRKKVTK